MVIIEVLNSLCQNLLIPTGYIIDLPWQVFDNIGRSIAGGGQWAQYEDVWGRTPPLCSVIEFSPMLNLTNTMRSELLMVADAMATLGLH
jgi:hypothetical protein